MMGNLTAASCRVAAARGDIRPGPSRGPITASNRISSASRGWSRNGNHPTRAGLNWSPTPRRGTLIAIPQPAPAPLPDGETSEPVSQLFLQAPHFAADAAHLAAVAAHLAAVAAHLAACAVAAHLAAFAAHLAAFAAHLAAFAA